MLLSYLSSEETLRSVRYIALFHCSAVFSTTNKKQQLQSKAVSISPVYNTIFFAPSYFLSFFTFFFHLKNEIIIYTYNIPHVFAFDNLKFGCLPLYGFSSYCFLSLCIYYLPRMCPAFLFFLNLILIPRQPTVFLLVLSFSFHLHLFPSAAITILLSRQ